MTEKHTRPRISPYRVGDWVHVTLETEVSANGRVRNTSVPGWSAFVGTVSRIKPPQDLDNMSEQRVVRIYSGTQSEATYEVETWEEEPKLNGSTTGFMSHGSPEVFITNGGYVSVNLRRLSEDERGVLDDVADETGDLWWATRLVYE